MKKLRKAFYVPYILFDDLLVFCLSIQIFVEFLWVTFMFAFSLVWDRKL